MVGSIFRSVLRQFSRWTYSTASLDDTTLLMYIIGIRKLKIELADGPLASRRALPYAIVWLSIMTILPYMSFSSSRPPEWTWLLATYSLFAVGCGVVLAYRANGGKDGVDFVARLLAVWLVVGIRVFLVLCIPLGLLAALWAPTPSGRVAPLLYELVETVALTLPAYWRAAVHMKEIRERSEEGSRASVPSVI